MTDSKTPDWMKDEASKIAMDIVPRMAMTFDHSHGLRDYDQRKAAELPFRQIAQHDITPAVSQALLSAYERGLRDAEKMAAPNVGPGIFNEYENGRRDAARAIRQLLEVKG